jgi:histidinol phosphatase-like enzyme
MVTIDLKQSRVMFASMIDMYHLALKAGFYIGKTSTDICTKK